MLAILNYPSWLKPEIIPGLPIRWYGLMYLVAFALAYYFFVRRVKELDYDMNREEIANFFFWAIIGVLLGGRIFSALVYEPSGIYQSNPLLIFWPFRNGRFVGLQGMSYHGGVIGVIAAVIIYAKATGRRFYELSELLAPGIPLGYTFGRLGNFINGELYGRVTSISWGMIFPHAERFSTDEPWVQQVAGEAGMDLSGKSLVNLPRHPSQLYEAFFEGIFLWIVLWLLLRKRSPFRGFLMGMYILGYGIVRFVIEYFRQPDPGMGFPIQLAEGANPRYLFLTPWNFTTGQILCALMIIGAAVFLILRKRSAEKRGESPLQP
ncbi:MAG: prolipoprotein diacylglyceryl transferase [Spirochaetales bacterium]|nr:prolipoprotein diacylglyceryl transferase [Spirochaetales bacterium]MCF7938690.1 prolipoprotein diacylglyceryl transferase [Spirochaetales bacterium]